MDAGNRSAPSSVGLAGGKFPETAHCAGPRRLWSEPSMLITLETRIRDFTEAIDQSPCDGCDHCGTRCTAGIQVLRSEYEAARAELKRLPADEVARVMGQVKRQPIPGTDE